jgi:hypothetical protein
MRNRGTARTISLGTEGLLGISPSTGEKTGWPLPATIPERGLLGVFPARAWAEFHSLTPFFFLPFNWPCNAISTPMETETPS